MKETAIREKVKSPDEDEHVLSGQLVGVPEELHQQRDHRLGDVGELDAATWKKRKFKFKQSSD